MKNFFGNRKAINKIMYVLAIIIIITTVILTFGAAFLNQNQAPVK